MPDPQPLSGAESPAAGAVHPDDVPGGAVPRYMPPMRRRPPAVGQPTPAQARAVATAGLVLTLVLAGLGALGVVWAVLAAVHR